MKEQVQLSVRVPKTMADWVRIKATREHTRARDIVVEALRLYKAHLEQQKKAA